MHVRVVVMVVLHDGVEHLVHAGEVLVMPAKKPHAVYAPEAFKWMLTVVFPFK